jgi:hypothetical protein
MTCCSMKHELIWHTAIQTTLAEASHSPALLRCGLQAKASKMGQPSVFDFCLEGVILFHSRDCPRCGLTDTWWHLKITRASGRVCRQVLTAKNETLSGLVVDGVLRRRYTYIVRYHPSFSSSVWNSSQLILEDLWQ